MVEEDRYCVDVLAALSAVTAVLDPPVPAALLAAGSVIVGCEVDQSPRTMPAH